MMGTTTEMDGTVSRKVGELTLTLVSDTEITMSREFRAPRELVFEAHSDCAHIRAWWGPRGHTMPACEMDFRPGGAWRFVDRDADGNDFVFFGEYREIVRPERIVWTFGFEGMEGDPSEEILLLEEHDGVTTLRTRSFFPSLEARDAMLGSGMEHGAAETWDRLAEHLATMR